MQRLLKIGAAGEVIQEPDLWPPPLCPD